MNRTIETGFSLLTLRLGMNGTLCTHGNGPGILLRYSALSTRNRSAWPRQPRSWRAMPFAMPRMGQLSFWSRLAYPNSS